MDWTGAQLEELHEALLSAYPNRADLSQLVRFKLNIRLNALAGGDNYSQLVFSLIEALEAQERLSQLVAAALDGNPGNQRLRAIATDTGLIQTEATTGNPRPSTGPALKPFKFVTAKLVKQEQGSWVIQQQRRREAHRYVEPLPEGVLLEMVEIPSGKFLMGSPESEADRASGEGPQHEVAVSRFFMGRYPVTQAQWQVVARLPQVERSLAPDPSSFKGRSRPVEKVSWYEAKEFCARLSIHTNREYRLPTEAEWEYACRSGTTTPFHFGEIVSPNLVNYNGNYVYADGPKGKYRKETTAVNYFEVANAFGLSDMHGNVWEWCQDCWHSNYIGAPLDGSAWIVGGDKDLRVRRGGSWDNLPGNCRSASRFWFNADYRTDNFGFRVCCSAPRTD